MTILKRIYRFGLVSAAFMLLISCGQSSNSPVSNTPSIKTIKWQLDESGFVQFFTNDAQYYNYGFFTTYNQTYALPMTTVTATVKKQSGNADSGYGIVFCSLDSTNLYRLLIVTTGYYMVSAKVGGTYSTIIPWTASANLNSGFGVENVISVVQQSPYYFIILFNGTQETTFSDGNFSGGRAGFSAFITSQANENFPYTPEDVRFKLSLPVTYP